MSRPDESLTQSPDAAPPEAADASDMSVSPEVRELPTSAEVPEAPELAATPSPAEVPETLPVEASEGEPLAQAPAGAAVAEARVEPAPEIAPLPIPTRRPWPWIGPALSVFAVLLWAFVVVGQLTTSWRMPGTPLGQGPAVLLVLLATFAAWVAGVLRSRSAVPPLRTAHLVGRGVGIAAMALGLFLGCLFAATVAGNVSSRNHDGLIAVTLVVLAAVAAIIGPALTSPIRPARTHGARVALAAVWIACVLLTLVAGADLAVNG